MVSNGLASYNGALVGCAFSVFLPGEWVPEIAAASAAGGAVSTILAVSLKNILTMPQCAPLLPPSWQAGNSVLSEASGCLLSVSETLLA